MSEKKKLILLCMANFIWSMGSFVNVVFLFFVPAKFNTTEIQTGIIMSLVSVAIFLGTVLYPIVIKRSAPIKIYRNAVTLGALCFGIASLNFDSFWIAIPFTLLGYIVFSLTRGLNKKIISIAIAPSMRRKAYNYNFALANLGGIFAGILSPFVFNLNVDNMQYIFLVNCISMIISYLVLAAGVRTETNTIEHVEKNKEANKFKIDYRLLIGTSAIYFAFFQITFLIPKTIEGNYSIHIYSLAIVINTLMCVVASPLSVNIFSRFGIDEYTAIRSGAVLMILSFIIYNIIAMPALIIATILFAIGEVLFITNLDSYLLKVYGESKYDRLLTSVRLLSQVNRAIGPLIASVAIVYLSYSYAYGIAIVYVIIGLISLTKFNKEVIKH